MKIEKISCPRKCLVLTILSAFTLINVHYIVYKIFARHISPLAGGDENLPNAILYVKIRWVKY